MACLLRVRVSRGCVRIGRVLSNLRLGSTGLFQTLVRSLALASIAFAAACSGGGDDELEQPVAAALVVGSSQEQIDVVVRSGSEVVLNGENSDGTRFPIEQAQWVQTDSTGIEVDLVKRTDATRAFRVPQVDEPVTLTFDLTVTNTDGDSATTRVTVRIVPVDDGDRFLELVLRVPGKYTVVAALRPGTVTTSPVTFSLTERQYVDYVDRDGNPRTNLMIAEPDVRSSQWLANVVSEWTTDDDAVKRYYHPNLVFDVPKLDIDEINLQFDDTDERSGIDDHQRDTVDHYVEHSLEVLNGTCEDDTGTVIDCQDAAIVYVLKTDGEPVAPPEYAAATDSVKRVSLDVVKARGDPTRLHPESRLSTAAYYDAVDPCERRTNFSDWLRNAGFTDASGQRVQDGSVARTLYVNNYDLGFTRDMFVRKDEDTGDVFAYVTNYPALRKAILREDTIATVAMEYGPPDVPNCDSPDQDSQTPFVKFFVFVDDGNGEQQRMMSLNFDGRGEKWVPGACVPCHGGNARSLEADGTYPAQGDVDAAFLPWDLDSFLYVDARNPDLVDPLVTRGLELDSQYILPGDLSRFSRENQESEFRRMNEATLATMVGPRFNYVRRQIHDWYGSTDYGANSLPEGVFDGRRHIPQDWVDAGQEEVYHEVFARHCRICHSQIGNALPQFQTYGELQSNIAQVHRLVFEEGMMPNARLDMDRFWVEFHGRDTPATRLAGALGFDVDDPDSIYRSGPGRPIARIRGGTIQSAFPVDPTAETPTEIDGIRNLGQVRLDGSISSFAEEFAWRLVQRPTSSASELTGANTAKPGFMIDQPGDYIVKLHVGNGRVALPDESVLAAPPLDPANVESDPCHASTNCALVKIDAQPYLPQQTGASFRLQVVIPETLPDPSSTYPDVPVTPDVLAYTDEDSAADQLTYVVRDPAPAHGAILCNGIACSTFTQQQIDRGIVFYQHDGSDGATDQVHFDVVDQHSNSVPGRLDVEITTPMRFQPMCAEVITLLAPSFLDPGLSRNGAARTSTTGSDIPWLSVPLADANLSTQCTDDNTPFEGLEFTVIESPATGTLSRASFRGSEVGSMSYTNSDFSQGFRNFTVRVSDGTSSDDFTLRVDQQFSFETDIGWVIDTVWSDAGSTDTTELNPAYCTFTGSTRADADGPRACAQCHFIDDSPAANTTGCGFPVWTDLRGVPGNSGGNLHCDNLRQRDDTGLLPDYPTTTNDTHPGGTIFPAGSYPHVLLTWWTGQTDDVQCRGNTPELP